MNSRGIPIRHHILKITLPWLILWSSCHVLAAPAADLIVRGDYVLTMNKDQQVIENGAVVVQDGAIAAVGTWADISVRYRAKQVLPGAQSKTIHALKSTISIWQ